MKASSSSGAWGRGFGEQIDGCGVGSRVNSAHITTADEQPSTRSEPVRRYLMARVVRPVV
jgi:hypothetical protein